MIPQLMISGVPINGHQLAVDAVIDMPQDDLSGNTSATDTADKGIKPKRLMVSLVIPFDKPGWLTALTTLAEQRDDNGEAAKHIIVDKLANALMIRQVIFRQSVNINEAEKQRVWDVSFTLTEHRSPAETEEKRREVREPQGAGDASSFRELNSLIEDKLQ